MNEGKPQTTSEGPHKSKGNINWEDVCYRALLLLMMLASLAVFVLLCKFIIDVVSMLLNFLAFIAISAIQVA